MEFPTLLGGIEGKNVVLQAPAHLGSDCLNYKKTHSNVLLDAYNTDHKFMLVDTGDAKHQSDRGVYQK